MFINCCWLKDVVINNDSDSLTYSLCSVEQISYWRCMVANGVDVSVGFNLNLLCQLVTH